MRRNDQQLGTTRKFSVCKIRLVLVAVAIGATGIAVASTAPQDTSRIQPPIKRSRFAFQIGKASWYGGKFQGRKTASGEKFDMNALTCAHRSLPLGSWIRVTNVANQKAVFLRVNDRGPVPRNILLDLSYAAARKLGIGGLAKVKIEPIRSNDPAMAHALLAELQAPRMTLGEWSPIGMPILPLEIASR